MGKYVDTEDVDPKDDAPMVDKPRTIENKSENVPGEKTKTQPVKIVKVKKSRAPRQRVFNVIKNPYFGSEELRHFYKEIYQRVERKPKRTLFGILEGLMTDYADQIDLNKIKKLIEKIEKIKEEKK